MKRETIFTILLACITFFAKASHITGGEMYYKFMGVLNGQYSYDVTLKLFQRCFSGRQFPNPAIISVFDKTNSSRMMNLEVAISRTENIKLANFNPCITNPPDVCYDVGYYEFSITLPASADGYVIASQVNFRIDGINNLSPGSSNVGATYTADIPGFSSSADAPKNTSAVFNGTDLVVVCAHNDFAYSFGALDIDGDQLRYSFCGAYASTTGNTLAPFPPPYPPVPYNLPDYKGDNPLGTNVHIDPNTGIITGNAPEQGIYVVTVCVEEIRNGQVIAIQRKDLQINIADCNIAAAALLPEYLLCRDTKSINISNQSNSPLINSYNWDFINNTGIIIHSSSDPSVSFNFPDTGLFIIKLAINRNEQCSDSTKAIVRVYPGFVPAFSSSGICLTKPTIFTDLTSSVYGTVNSWTWDFGEGSSFTDGSSLQNPTYTYLSMGIKDARLITADNKGCRDTITKTITIIDKPPILLAFKDTLICVNDDLHLQASGTGIYTWSPSVGMTNPNSPSPIVSPTVTTTYYADLNDDGCLNRDSVRVNVVDHVTIQAMNDTTICKGDTIRLSVISDALLYNWSPALQLIDPIQKDPDAITFATTTYTVLATIGGCSGTEDIIVTAVPYPRVDAGADTAVCFEAPAQLHGTTDGLSWHWTPEANLDNADLLNPLSHSNRTITYVITAYDNKGCPKPGVDSILVTVQPQIHPFAGNDTAIVIGQPLQLNATGANYYEWSPGQFLSSPNIPNPVAIFNDPSSGRRLKVLISTDEGCVDSAFITIKVFKSAPVVFVPSAFTPNGDGKNDILRPITAGISGIEYFEVFDRWGQLIFSTSINGAGWDGRVSGQVQGTGTFVWIVKAKDYTGAAYFSKGMVTLIR